MPPQEGGPGTAYIKAGQWYRVLSWSAQSNIWVRCGSPFSWEVNSAHPPFHLTGHEGSLLHQNVVWTFWWGECRIKADKDTWYRSSFRGDPGVP
jgi:hypothetical protein